MGFNGSRIGRINTSTLGSASGVWSVNEVHLGRQQDTWPVTDGFNVDVLLVGGGGGGGSTIGAGAGAGGILIGTLRVNKATTYAVVIGAGGSQEANGNSSSAFNVTAYGGGGSRGYTTSPTLLPGFPGGSGGGGSGTRPNGATSNGGAATQTNQSGFTGYGFAGGIGTSSGDPIQPAGGGGAGELGENGIRTGTTRAGAGGNGIFNSYRTDVNVGYGGGGNGYSYNSGAIAPDKRATYGGGTAVAQGTSSAGVANTGGGGGGGGFFNSPSVGGTGGSGICVVRYLSPQKATGGTVTTYTSNSDGKSYVVHTFLSTSSFIT